jgi:hypothetical protein
MRLVGVFYFSREAGSFRQGLESSILKYINAVLSILDE